ncbi:MAG TPA: sigma-70 family RNA polymerase sigma factor [Saprospiraceae bacterium]|nr:sigma-70 family RNA polymerase sigma factor [Saprospiraceae bacterium]
MVEDIHLIQQVLKGNQAAFRSLMERYQSYVFTIAYKVLKNRESAEEVAQDVFIKVYRMLGSYQQKSKFSTWLYTIAYRTALDEARKKKRYSLSIEADDQHLQIADEDGKSPAFDLQQADLNKQLEAAIQHLKPIDATLITLYYLNEKNVQEIQVITGLTKSNIKTKLFRLREQLREQLKQQLQEEVKDLL